MKKNKIYADYIGKYLENNYFTSKIMIDIMNQEVTTLEKQAYIKAKAIFDSLSKNQLYTCNESEIISDFITKILDILSYSHLREETFSIQGKSYKLDFVLFDTNKEKQAFLEMSKKQNKEERLNDLSKYLILEAKSPNEKLDNSKLNAKNPHYQLLNYLSGLRCDWGILTNAKQWRLYDGSKRYSQKVFIQFNLYDILENNEENCFYLFYRIFNSSFFFSKKPEETISHAKELDKIKILDLENRLAEIIYGTEANAYRDSAIENIGTSLYDYYSKKDNNIDLKDIFHNSSILVFRLVFLFYYESRFRNTLKKHRAYEEYSIYSFYKNKVLRDNSSNEDHNLYGALISYFDKLANGDTNLEIPMLNGGLFDANKAKLLNKKEIINNGIIKNLFKTMLIGSIIFDVDNTVFDYLQQDFSLIDIKKLGEIYENLLEYEFRIATENTYLIGYGNTSKGESSQSGTFVDALDLAMLKKEYKNTTEYKEYKKGSIYLVSLSNNRKQTASYYTPEIFTKFMVSNAIEDQLTKGKTIYEISLIDNACGSGHFLVDALIELTNRALIDFTRDDRPPMKHETFMESLTFKNLIQDEKNKITENIENLGIKDSNLIDEFLDEEQILKRILLKKCIFGVDYNILAIEIARLALWMETFIFATPLSFIEHHIKQGNSLIGSSLHDYKSIQNQQKQMDFLYNTDDNLHQLEVAYNKIIHLSDTTVEEIKESKRIYKQEVIPIINGLNELLNLINYYNFLRANTKDVEFLKNLGLGNFFINKIKSKGMIKEVFSITGKSDDIHVILNAYNNKEEEFLAELKTFVKMFSPFNYEVEFPDAQLGFDIVVGNPPWDESVADDKDFFSQYNTVYRSMSIKDKEALRNKYLKGVGYSFIKDHYKQYSSFIKTYNNYLKLSYPLNAGVGDNNLYKFFIERNLRLLKAETGVLNYLTPSVWSYAKGATIIRKYILNNFKLDYFYQFENRQKIGGKIFNKVHPSYKFANYQIRNEGKLFDKVDSRYKFANYQITQSAMNDDFEIKFLFMQNETSFLEKNPITERFDLANKKALKITLGDIKKLSPEEYSILEINCKEELFLIKKLYSKYNSLSEKNINFYNELHMTNDRQILAETNDYIGFYRELDVTNDKNLLLENSNNNNYIVFEGKNIHQFNPLFEKNKYYANIDNLEKSQLSKEIYRLKSQNKSNKFLQYIKLEDKIDYRYKYYKLAFRSIASGTNERTLISCVLPKKSTFVNSLNATVPFKYEVDGTNISIKLLNSTAQLFFINSVFNSLIIDYILRLSLDINVNMFLLKKLPIPQPTTEEILNNPDYKKLMENAVILSSIHAKNFYTDAVEELNIDLQIIEDNKSNLNRLKTKLMVENDCIVAKLYNLTLEELEIIINTFPVFNKKNHGYKDYLLTEYNNYI